MLEQRASMVTKTGTSLVLLPIGLRMLERFSLAEALNAVSTPLGRVDRIDHAGQDIGDVQWFLEMTKR